ADVIRLDTHLGEIDVAVDQVVLQQGTGLVHRDRDGINTTGVARGRLCHQLLDQVVGPHFDGVELDAGIGFGEIAEDLLVGVGILAVPRDEFALVLCNLTYVCHRSGHSGFGRAGGGRGPPGLVDLRIAASGRDYECRRGDECQARLAAVHNSHFDLRDYGE